MFLEYRQVLGYVAIRSAVSPNYFVKSDADHSKYQKKVFVWLKLG